MIDFKLLYKKVDHFRPVRLYNGRAERTIWWFVFGNTKEYKSTLKVSGDFIGSIESFRFIRSSNLDTYCKGIGQNE